MPGLSPQPPQFSLSWLTQALESAGEFSRLDILIRPVSEGARRTYVMLKERADPIGFIGMTDCLELSNDLLKRGRLTEAMEYLEELQEAGLVMRFADGWRVRSPQQT